MDKWLISRPARAQPAKQTRFASVIVVAVLVTVALFTIAMTVVFCVKGSVPDTLIVSFYGSMGTELVSAAGIRIFKREDKKDDD